MAENRKLINTDLSIIQGATSTFFTGVDDLITTSRLDPIVTGYSFVRILDVPTWFQKDEDLKYFSDMLNKNTRGFSGPSDIELQFAQHQSGFANAEFNVVTGVNRGSQEFTLTHKEYAGSPMRRLYQKYISMIRDPRTGLAMYPSIYDVEYGSKNHTFSLIYMVVKPSLMAAGSKASQEKDMIEYAAFYSNAMPQNVPISDLYGNWTMGEQESPTISVQWNGFMEIGPDVEALALKVLKDDILNTKSESGGIPFVDSMGLNKDAVKSTTNAPGFLKKIYNPSTDK